MSAALRFALVTPSYHLDYEQCLLLIDSVHKYVPEHVHHYLVISRDDYDLFVSRADERTHVLVQEDIVQEQFWRVPGARRWRFNLRTLVPVRGWVWQQVVKMSLPNQVDADAYMIVDSDCFFVRPFDPCTLVRDGRVPMFREEKEWYATSAPHQRWSQVSRRLLRLPPSDGPCRAGYICPWAFWRRDVLLKLQAHISGSRRATTWIRDVSRNLAFSEYMLYGIYVDQVLGLENSGHYGFDQHICLEEFDEAPQGPAQLDALRHELAEEVLVMINARGRTSVPLIRSKFGF